MINTLFQILNTQTGKIRELKRSETKEYLFGQFIKNNLSPLHFSLFA